MPEDRVVRCKVVGYAHGRLNPFYDIPNGIIDWDKVPEEAWLKRPDELDQESGAQTTLWGDETKLTIEGMGVMDCEDLHGKTVEIRVIDEK